MPESAKQTQLRFPRREQAELPPAPAKTSKLPANAQKMSVPAQIPILSAAVLSISADSTLSAAAAAGTVLISAAAAGASEQNCSRAVCHPARKVCKSTHHALAAAGAAPASAAATAAAASLSIAFVSLRTALGSRAAAASASSGNRCVFPFVSDFFGCCRSTAASSFTCHIPYRSFHKPPMSFAGYPCRRKAPALLRSDLLRAAACIRSLSLYAVMPILFNSGNRQQHT